MKSYHLKNDDVQHAERLFLEAYYRKLTGRRVPYSDILHDLQREHVRQIKATPPPPETSWIANPS